MHVRCRDKGEFTDFVLRSKEDEFKVHKVVVCSQSKILHKACTGTFKVINYTSTYMNAILTLSNRKLLLEFTK
jgi:speckle-type POZ protein